MSTTRACASKILIGRTPIGLVPLADLEIVEVVGRSDLDRARPLLRIGVLIGDDRDQPADQGQTNPLADQMLEARVVRMDGDRGVAEHRLRPRGGDGHALAGLFAVGVDDRIVEVVEMAVRILGEDLGERGGVERRAVRARPFEGALGLDLHDLEIRDRGLELGVPVDEPLVLVDEPLAIELDEDLGHRAREALVKREPLAAPVAGGAETLELGDDRAARLRLPRPDALHEGLAAERAPVGLLTLHELALDHHLGRDAGVVDARLPQHVAPVHAPIATKDVLQRVVERMAHVQIAGDVRRRNDDAERPSRRPALGARPGTRPSPPRARRPGLRPRRSRTICPSWDTVRAPAERLCTDRGGFRGAGAERRGAISASQAPESTRRRARPAEGRQPLSRFPGRAWAGSGRNLPRRTVGLPAALYDAPR